MQKPSLLTQTVYHRTTTHAEASIRRYGFKPGYHGVWGTGCYFALDPQTLNLYVNKGDAIIEAKVLIERPFILHGYGPDEGFRDSRFRSDLTAYLRGDEHGLPLNLSEEDYISYSEAAEHLRHLGYDSIIYTEESVRPNPGGNQICVFDPARINVLPPKPAPVPVPVPAEERLRIIGSNLPEYWQQKKVTFKIGDITNA